MQYRWLKAIVISLYSIYRLCSNDGSKPWSYFCTLYIAYAVLVAPSQGVNSLLPMHLIQLAPSHGVDSILFMYLMQYWWLQAIVISAYFLCVLCRIIGFKPLWCLHSLYVPYVLRWLQAIVISVVSLCLIQYWWLQAMGITLYSLCALYNIDGSKPCWYLGTLYVPYAEKWLQTIVISV